MNLTDLVDVIARRICWYDKMSFTQNHSKQLLTNDNLSKFQGQLVKEGYDEDIKELNQLGYQIRLHDFERLFIDLTDQTSPVGHFTPGDHTKTLISKIINKELKWYDTLPNNDTNARVGRLTERQLSPFSTSCDISWELSPLVRATPKRPELINTPVRSVDDGQSSKESARIYKNLLDFRQQAERENRHRINIEPIIAADLIPNIQPITPNTQPNNQPNNRHNPRNYEPAQRDIPPNPCNRPPNNEFVLRDIPPNSCNMPPNNEPILNDIPPNPHNIPPQPPRAP